MSTITSDIYVQFFYKKRLKPGGQCPVNSLEWINDRGEDCQINTFFTEGALSGTSKGLKNIAVELGLQVDGMKLGEIKALLKAHPAFEKKTRLQAVCERYNVKLIYVPKYHCELNPIEGLWCHQKRYVRTRTDQSFEKMILLIEESREDFALKFVNNKLIRRFWNVIAAYKKR